MSISTLAVSSLLAQLRACAIVVGEVSLLVLLVAAASVLGVSGQTEPYLVTKARLTRSAAVSATSDFNKANALVAQRAQELNAADKALADAAAAYNDALPLVNRLKNTLAQKLAAKDKTASVIPDLQENLDAAKAGVSTTNGASGTDSTDLASAVANAQQRVNMTAQQVEGQKEALLNVNSAVAKATQGTANPNMTAAEAAVAQAALNDKTAMATLAKQILDDMVAQAKSAQQALAKLQNAANGPSATAAPVADKSAVDAAQAALDAAVKADNDAAAAVAQATSDVSDAQASVPARSAAVTNAKIAQSKAVAAKASADTGAAAMKSRMDAAVAVAESAEAGAKTAGYSWTW
ncbi:unnamed protein product [Closterium sp. Naga37s-1]|nr:unnamed protein product [Closterium sp. Naga37s-1]